MDYHSFYSKTNPQIIKIDDASIAVRTYGKGTPLLFVHGFFVYGYTWRKLLPKLSEEFTCYVVDLPGFGSSAYSKDTDFSFTAQANRLNKLIDLLGINNQLKIIAHDTGASIARLLGLEKSNNIEKLILINTEIPNHRPPYIPMYQFLARLPLANLMFRTLLKFDFIVTSPLLINQFFFDKSRFKNKSNYYHYVQALSDKKKMFGMIEYLKGIEWKVVDDFAKNHKNIDAQTLFLWGEEDKTFPVNRAKKMVTQFNGNCMFETIERTCIMPHEEKPNEVLKIILKFLKSTKTPQITDSSNNY